MNAETAVALLSLAIQGIGDIVKEVRESKKEAAGVERAADALTAIGAIVETVNHGDMASIDIGSAEGELKNLLSALKGNDDAADEALDKKFDR